MKEPAARVPFLYQKSLQLQGSWRPQQYPNVTPQLSLGQTVESGGKSQEKNKPGCC